MAYESINLTNNNTKQNHLYVLFLNYVLTKTEPNIRGIRTKNFLKLISYFSICYFEICRERLRMKGLISPLISLYSEAGSFSLNPIRTS